MEIRKRFAKNIAVLYITGKINIDSARIIEETGFLVKEGIQKIVCNFTHVEFVDYNGLSILAIAYKNVGNQKGMLKFCNVPMHVRELFKAARLDTVFEIYDDEESALKSFELSNKVDRLRLRRRFKRIDMSLPVRFKNGLASKNGLLNGRILNLSAEGLFIYSRKTFPVSTQLYLELKLPHKKKSLILCGIVVWLADRELQPHSFPGMGLYFKDIGKKEQDDIIEFIDKNITRRSRV